MLGGSSSVNGMMYVRGHARDYDRWAQAGCRGWSYADVLPYFRRAEAHDAGADAYHGDTGPLRVASGRLDHPLCRAFVEAGVEGGHPRSDDVNGARQEGFGRMDRTTFRGRRWSTANAYLKPAGRRPNLRILTRALAASITFDGRRAASVRYRHKGRDRAVRATRAK